MEATAARYDDADVLAYLDVLNFFMTLLPEAMTYQSTALTAPVTGAFPVWLGHAK
jgi:hypothetical protein